MSLSDLITRGLTESMPRGDLTTRHLKFPHADTVTKLTAREDLVLAGRAAFEMVLRAFAPEAEINWQFADGDLILTGQSVAWIKAPPGALLSAQPLAHQLIGRASGIATLTRCYKAELRGTRAKLTTLRQTTPGLGELEFEAVRLGGAVTPEGDRSTTLFITTAHARAAGSLAAAFAQLREGYHGPVEVACASLTEVEMAVDEKAARIVIEDTVDPAAARTLIPQTIPLEAGGVISIERARELALSEVDFVRVDQLVSAAPHAGFALT